MQLKTKKTTCFSVEIQQRLV